ncbi:SLAM family member 9-like [Sebastes umbrosus]|uniref:SLAM family member 9-like n=1 Tax=Sebastes umbrosus TaxID=72105 RepID=UPI0018A01209|nr:SLAM family member 9-like [Sebastes umbrosus]
MSIFVILGLLVCIIAAQGPSAVTPVFVQKGGDVLLNVDADVPVDFFIVEWNFNKTVVLVRFPSGREPLVPPVYAGRIEFLEKKYSVKLKNLQEADSGVYTAKASSTVDQTLAEYNVTVQGPVSPVNLTVISVDSRSSECDLTVTTSGASLRIYLSSSSIICNHSNQVSWTKVIKIIEHVCLQPDDPVCPPAGISVCLLKIVVFSVGLIIMVSAVITVHLMEKLKKNK